MEEKDTKICPACNRAFKCTSDDDCWCEKVHITRKNMYALLQKYDDCICPVCMKRYETD